MFLELKYNDKTYTNNTEILNILSEKNFSWLIDSEVRDAIIEIKSDTIIWKGGDYLSGNWVYGIFEDGIFYGNWHNGIFVNGTFSGVNKDKKNTKIKKM